MTTESRPYGGASAEQRRQQRRAKLIAAAFDLWSERGVAMLSVRSVCTAAALNDRYFYESFRDCDELVMAVVDDQIAQGAPLLLAALEQASTDLGGQSRAGVESLVNFLLGDPRRHRLLAESAATESLRTRRTELITQVATVMAAVGGPLVKSSPHPNALSEADQVKLGTLMLASGALELTVMWVRGDLEITQGQLVDAIVAMVVSAAQSGRH